MILIAMNANVVNADTEWSVSGPFRKIEVEGDGSAKERLMVVGAFEGAGVGEAREGTDKPDIIYLMYKRALGMIAFGMIVKLL
jgi:hypothetical protein